MGREIIQYQRAGADILEIDRNLSEYSAEFERRIRKVRSEMERLNLTHLVAYGNYADPGNITWLSGFYTRHGDSFVLVPLDGEPVLATNWVMHDEPMHSEIWTSWLDDVRPCTPFTYDLVDEVSDAIRRSSLADGKTVQRVQAPHGFVATTEKSPQVDVINTYIHEINFELLKRSK